MKMQAITAVVNTTLAEVKIKRDKTIHYSQVYYESTKGQLPVEVMGWLPHKAQAWITTTQVVFITGMVIFWESGDSRLWNFSGKYGIALGYSKKKAMFDFFYENVTERIGSGILQISGGTSLTLHHRYQTPS